MIVSPNGAYRVDRSCPDGGRCSHLCPDANWLLEGFVL